MRTIRFRGQTNSGEWVYGSLLTWPDGKVMIYDTLLADGSMGGHEVKSETVGQFLGHCDDQDYYEGDIVEDEWGQRFSIEWQQDDATFKIYDAAKECYHPMWDSVLTVIGNVHEHLDLLG